MRRHHYHEERASLNATRKPAKRRMTMREAVQPYLARMAALQAQREADRLQASINWTGDLAKAK